MNQDTKKQIQSDLTAQEMTAQDCPFPLELCGRGNASPLGKSNFPKHYFYYEVLFCAYLWQEMDEGEADSID